MSTTAITWLRNDLRVADNPALEAASRVGGRVVALYVHETTEGVRPPGAAARWWLHQSLGALELELARRGITLEIREGDAVAVVPAAAADHGAGWVHWNRRYAPAERQADAAIKDALRQHGVDAQSHPGNVLVEPWEIATGHGKPYSVFTPFWKTLKKRAVAAPLALTRGGAERAASAVDASYRAPHWTTKLGQYWTVGEAAARERLAAFLDGDVAQYPRWRDSPALAATSRLSPHLRFGEISARQVWHAAIAAAHADHRRAVAVDKFLSELAWRDFHYHQLYHRADVAAVAMQPKYARMAWRDSRHDLERWQQGRTGIPMVDAGMRELRETGFMQNRVRMLAASLLAKNLLIDWRVGERWFWDCLVDADVASNPGNWQWVAGSGLDASPYYRIFNPVTQGLRFDTSGRYVRRWVPELAELPDEWIHRPFEAPAAILERAGVLIGGTYPAPIVDLRTSRRRALEAAQSLGEE